MEKRNGNDRRKVNTDYRRRRWNRREGVYYYERTCYLTNTNHFQNCYFAEYFDFIGEAREDFFFYLVGPMFKDLEEAGVELSTVKTGISYIGGLTLFDSFRINVRIIKVQRIKVELQFEFVKSDGSQVADASMVICFKQHGKPMPIPDFIKERLLELNMQPK